VCDNTACFRSRKKTEATNAFAKVRDLYGRKYIYGYNSDFDIANTRRALYFIATGNRSVDYPRSWDRYADKIPPVRSYSETIRAYFPERSHSAHPRPVRIAHSEKIYDNIGNPEDLLHRDDSRVICQLFIIRIHCQVADEDEHIC
jgi:hypothetical protein